MALKLATLEDIDSLYAMCQEFYRQTDLNFELNKDYGISFLQSHIPNPDHLSLIWEQDSQQCGCLLAFALPHPFLPIRVANELVWWMHPSTRGKGSLKLFQAFEYWAKEIKHCETICVTSTSSTDPSLEKYYQRKGYSRKETTWSKNI